MELAGILEVPEVPEITTGYTDIYRGIWKTPQGEHLEVAIKEFKALIPRNRHSDPEALRRRADTVRTFQRPDTPPPQTGPSCFFPPHSA